MLQLKNNTPFKPGMAIFPDKNGIDTFYAVIKATFTLGDKQIRIAENQVSPVIADEYWDKPGESSLRYASDMHLGKLSTDVVLNDKPGHRKENWSSRSILRLLWQSGRKLFGFMVIDGLLKGF